jgi:uncharacterized protein (DUF58 family)
MAPVVRPWLRWMVGNIIAVVVPVILAIMTILSALTLIIATIIILSVSTLVSLVFQLATVVAHQRLPASPALVIVSRAIRRSSVHIVTEVEVRIHSFCIYSLDSSLGKRVSEHENQRGSDQQRPKARRG